MAGRVEDPPRIDADPGLPFLLATERDRLLTATPEPDDALSHRQTESVREFDENAPLWRPQPLRSSLLATPCPPLLTSHAVAPTPSGR